jgi:hypothetical protein
MQRALTQLAYVTLLAPNESLVRVRRFDVAGSVIKENLLKRAVHGDESLWRHGDEIVSMRSRDVAERVHAKRMLDLCMAPK